MPKGKSNDAKAPLGSTLQARRCIGQGSSAQLEIQLQDERHGGLQALAGPAQRFARHCMAADVSLKRLLYQVKETTLQKYASTLGFLDVLEYEWLRAFMVCELWWNTAVCRGCTRSAPVHGILSSHSS